MNKNKKNAHTYIKGVCIFMNKENDSKEYGEDASKYGEFILSYFAWLSPEEQKQKTEKLQKITKNNEIERKEYN